MLSLSQPHPLHDIVASIDARTPLGSAMRTAEWEQVPAGLRDAAFFSASVESTRYLQAAKDGIAEIIGSARAVNDKGQEYWKMDRARLMADLRRFGEHLAVQRPGGREGGRIREKDITDPLSQARLRLMIETQLEMAYGKADWLASMDPDILEAFPCWELVRISDRMVPRDWPARWKAAGGAFSEGGRMIALKTSEIWKKISRFGNPHPPFDFNSGMGVDDVDRAESEDLGLIGPEDVLTPNVSAHQAELKASLKGISPALKKDLEQKLNSIVTTSEGQKTSNQIEIKKGELTLVTPRSAAVIKPGAWERLQTLMPQIQRSDLRALASAHASSSLDVRVDDQGRVILDSRTAGHTTIRSISQDKNGALFIENELFFLRPADRGRNAAGRILLQQAQAAQRLGAAYLRAEALLKRDPQDPARQTNGAIVWPRYGYDGPLPPDIAASAAADLGVEVLTIQELLRQPGGLRWWDQNAVELTLTFDLSDGSESFNILHAYLRRYSAP